MLRVIQRLLNSTLSGNTAGVSGVMNGGAKTLQMLNVTISDNTSVDTSRELILVSGPSSPAFEIKNTIIAGNHGGSNCDFSLATVSWGNVWVDDASCDGTNLGDPKLGPLTNDGGPTKTHALLVGSGAMDAGNAAVCAAAPVSGVDQRGVPRPQGAKCDIGAYEYRDETSFFVVPLPGGKSVIFGL